jgi:electron transport complex protein RnfB
MDNAYTRIAASLNYPESDLLVKILQKSMTPEEGRLILALPLPAAELAAKFDTTEEKINGILQDLWFRGLVALTPEGYASHSSVVWLHDWTLASDSVDADLLQLWKDLYDTEWSRDIAQELAMPTGPPLIRLVPSPQSLDAYSANATDPVLPYEDPRKIVAGVDLIGLRNHCVCRRMVKCGHPLDTCLQFNQYAEQDIERSFARKISVDEAISVLNRSAESGLIHFLGNKAEISQLRSICNCCVCACIVVNSASKYGTLPQVISKTRYEATVDTETCTGCELCVDLCNFDAIKMVESAGSKNDTAQIDPEKCWGCGACYTACVSEAISLKLVRPVSHIPVASQPSPSAAHS